MKDYFSADYSAARKLLLDVIQQRGGWQHEAIAHPLAAPDGAPIFTDVFWRGPKNAARVLTLCSGTHGVEGFTGSAIQSALADRAPELADDVAILMVHAVNPHGFSHLRRVNEDNVDLNRNFIDFSQRLPLNDGYGAIDGIVNPSQWTADTGTDIAGHIRAMQADMPYLEFLRTISGGQYHFPRGIQFGGSGPAWSRRTMERIWAQYLGDAELIVQIDIHTGLGSSGQGILMMAANEDEPHKGITADWFGPMMVTPRPASVHETVLGGYMNAALEQDVDAWVMPMTLEFGTEPAEAVLMTLIKDNWLANHGDPSSVTGREIRQQVLRAFYPDNEAWQAKVMARANAVITQTLDGITNLNLSARISK